jgi:magnesium chelatase subunit D
MPEGPSPAEDAAATPTEGPAPSPATDSALAAALLAVDPVGLGGALLRARPGRERDRWLALFRALLPDATPWRRIPHGVADDRLLGGLDLPATLRAGRPVATSGLLAEADGGILLLAMAERAEPGTAARLAAMLDTGRIAAERDGLALGAAARCAVLALDEGMEPDEQAPAALRDRLAFAPALGVPPDATDMPTMEEIAAARARLPGIAAPDAVLEALAGTALALGVESLRAPILALRAARAAAALAGLAAITIAEASIGARLVLGPRATRLPAPPPEDSAEPPPPEEPPPDQEPDSAPEEETEIGEIPEQVLDAVLASLPPDLLNQLRLAAGAPPRSAGKAGQFLRVARRGRPIGARPGELRGANRLALVQTLTAAAPWQRLRRQPADPPHRLRITRDDIRIQRYRQRAETATIFVVDASGSAALNRLAEAKGAVELLLADCYVRRDRVALIAFRGPTAEVLLPPTSSLVRARRSLAGLPGGGGTPMAAALDAARLLADQVRRRGQTPLLVLLTDGRANICRDGQGGRARANEEALQAARQLRADGFAGIWVDTSPRPQEAGRLLAAAAGIRYLPLPAADAATLSRAVRQAAA